MKQKQIKRANVLYTVTTTNTTTSTTTATTANIINAPFRLFRIFYFRTYVRTLAHLHSYK